MKYNFLTVALFSVLITGISGCKKYLDVVPQNVGTLEYAFRNRNEAEKYLFTCYNALQQRANVQLDPWFVTSGDLALPQEQLGAIGYAIPGFELVKGTTQRTDNVTLDYWGGGSSGNPSYYIAIRRCNTFLENVNNPIDLSDNEKARWIAEVKFLKAYYHFFLAKLYGPIPIVKDNLPITASTTDVRVNRAPVDSVFNYVVALLDEAAENLPLVIDNVETEMGRITKLIAKSLKAEVLIAQASPLFNGNPDYASFKDKQGVNLFSTTTDNALWTKASVACKEAIDLAESISLGLYKFLPPPNLANSATLTDSLKYEMNFRGAITEEWDKNKELVWAVNGFFPFQLYMYPKVVANSQNPRGMNTIVCPFAVTDLFYTSGGVPINEDKDWDYANRFTLQNGDAGHRYYLKEGYQTIKNNFNRETRYYATFGFDGSKWAGNGVGGLTNTAASIPNIEGKGPASLAGVTNPESANIFGIWPKKLCHWLSVVPNTSASISMVGYRLPLIRMADLYLMYAEALNEANGPSADVYHYVDMIRARTGLKGVLESWTAHSTNPTKPTTKEGLREIIQRERNIEFCFEGKAGWDNRRWKKYIETGNRLYQGWTVSKATGIDYYQLMTFYSPSISIKDYFWPISMSELLRNENLVQNPFW